MGLQEDSGRIAQTWLQIDRFFRAQYSQEASDHPIIPAVDRFLEKSDESLSGSNPGL
jgi:hypothetical protein